MEICRPPDITRPPMRDDEDALSLQGMITAYNRMIGLHSRTKLELLTRCQVLTERVTLMEKEIEKLVFFIQSMPALRVSQTLDVVPEEKTPQSIYSTGIDFYLTSQSE